jgi:hypothetical protein
MKTFKLKEVTLIILLRIILTAVLVYFIYGETGPVTSFAFVLMAITNEALALWMRNVKDCIKALKI